jgi:hypothetical protein
VSIILARQEAEVEGSRVEVGLGKSRRPYLKTKTKQKWVGSVDQVLA